MRRAGWTPSIVPGGDDQDVYMVADDLGRLGCIWPEADFEATEYETVTTDLLEGQYSGPFRVISFNTAEGWSRDVSEDVARELRRRCDLQLRELPSSIQDFVERYARSSPPTDAAAGIVMSWNFRFSEPIVLADGVTLRTLGEAVAYLAEAVPESEHGMKEVQAAAHCLMQAAEYGGPVSFARIGVMQAIHRHEAAAARLARQRPTGSFDGEAQIKAAPTRRLTRRWPFCC